ncbi:TniQ family protein [Lysinibacillus sp. FSL L8-0126]|uniref:TniQ family protein n=1 Tax=Lysinibacillus sp. FSL L8-0126 TaxID=2921515 RepID=UPI00315B2A7E
MKPFLNKIAIDESETLSSYLFRLFQCNYHEVPFGIFNTDFTKYSFVQNQINEDACKQLSFITGQEALYQLSYKSINIDADKAHLLFLKTQSKCCPLCLEEKIYQDFTWGFNHIYVCLKHHIYLLKECNRCKKTFRIYALYKNKCNGCGQPLSKLKAESVTDALILSSQKEFSDLFCGWREKFLDVFDINDIFLVLTAFSQLFDGLKSLTQTNVPIYKSEHTNRIPITQEGMIFFLTDIYWLFKDFDTRFPLFLTKVFEQEATRKVRRKRGNFENIIKSHSNLQFIYDAYQKYRHDHFVQPMKVPKNIKSYDSYALDYIQEHYFTSKQLKEEFGLFDRELLFLIQSDSFKDCFINNGNTIYFYKDKTKKFLDTFFKDKADRVRAGEVAELLGISIDRVTDLKNNGLLDYSPYLKNDKSFSKKQINQLLNSLKPQRTTNTENMIPFSRCFAKFATSGLSVTQLISFIRENGLIAYTQIIPYKFSDLWFDVNDLILRLNEKRIYTKGYNLKQVAQKLGCAEGTVMKYVKAGLLGHPNIEKQSSEVFAYRFDPKEIDLFKERYLSTKEVMKEFNVSGTLINNAVYRGAVKNYSTGICRKTIINRKEFEEYRARLTGKVKT